MKTKTQQAGFVVSIEMLLMIAVLVFGTITAWTKLRDQSIAELHDTAAAVDTYLQGTSTLWQTGGTRWIKAGAVIEPPVTGYTDDGYSLVEDPDTDGHFTDRAGAKTTYLAPSPE
jgi:hypothetical protein